MEFIYALLTILGFMVSVFVVVFFLTIGTQAAFLRRLPSKEELKHRANNTVILIIIGVMIESIADSFKSWWKR